MHLTGNAPNKTLYLCFTQNLIKVLLKVCSFRCLHLDTLVSGWPTAPLFPVECGSLEESGCCVENRTETELEDQERRPFFLLQRLFQRNSSLLWSKTSFSFSETVSKKFFISMVKDFFFFCRDCFKEILHFYGQRPFFLLQRLFQRNSSLLWSKTFF